MKYCIDTNIMSAVMRLRPDAVEHWRRQPADHLLVPAIVLAEGFFGAFKSNSQRWLAAWQQVMTDYSVIPFNHTCVVQYGQLRSTLESQGQMIGLHDCQIAATALAWQQTNPNDELTLVTDNLREFSRVPHLRLENWLG